MKKIFVLLCPFCLLISSCTFYYTTAEIDTNLKSTLGEAETANNKAKEQINAVFKSYEEIPCDKKSNPYQQAENLKLEVNSKMTSVNQHVAAMQAIYGDFKMYTEGKNKITSKSHEWEKVKKTKELLKIEADELQKEFQVLVEVSNKFTSHVQNEIINKTEFCLLANTIKELDNATSTIRKSAADYRSSAQAYDKQIQDLNIKFSSKYPKEIEKLNASTTEIRELSNEINLVIASLDKSSHKFKTATKGIEKLYSCDPKWETIKQLKKETSDASERLNEIEIKTKQIIENNQALVLSLK